MARSAAVVCLHCECGKTPHYGDEDGCWGRNCIGLPVDQRCRSWSPSTVAKAKKAETVTVPTPAPADDLWERRGPTEGSLASQIHDLVTRSEDGLTCDEVERTLHQPHQSVSAAVNWLMQHGWIEDSGRRRKTRYARDAIVWVDRDRPQASLPGLPG